MQPRTSMIKLDNSKSQSQEIIKKELGIQTTSLNTINKEE